MQTVSSILPDLAISKDSLHPIHQVLLSHPMVADCAVLYRSPAGNSNVSEPVAYIVSSGSFQPERLHTHLKSALPEADLPSDYVAIASLPLTAEGEVDTEALLRLEVIDDGLVSRWENRLQELGNITEIAVVVHEETHARPLLHLSDVLPSPSILDTHERNARDPKARLGPEDEGSDLKPAMAFSLSEGPALLLDSDAPRTLSDALRRAAATDSQKEIIYVRSDGTPLTQSYAELCSDAERILGGLRGLGLQAGDKVLFQLEHNQDFIPAFWGCVLGGFVPVPLSIAPTYDQLNGTINKLHNTWEMLNRPVILTGRELEGAVRSLADLLQCGAMWIVTVESLRASERDCSWHVSQPEDVALMLLTSGSTGMPKGVLQRHSSLLSRSAASAQHAGFCPDDVLLNWFPIDHVGGIVMFHLQALYVGCGQVHAPTTYVLRDVLKWLDLVDHYRISVTWAPNFAYGLINARAEELAKGHWDLSSLWFILNAGEAIVAGTARRFMELLTPHGLPHTAMRPCWGMSETCSGVTYSDRFTLDQTSDGDTFVEVGSPIPGFRMRIVDAEGQLVQESKVGRLEVQGPSVTTGYYNNPEINSELFSSDGWFNTGDLGMLRGGRLTITGRQKDVIIVNGLNFYCHELEAAVEGVNGVAVSYTAACAVRSRGSDTDELAIFFHTAETANAGLVRLLKQIRDRVVRTEGIYPKYLIPVEQSVIPKTQIGKIQRSELRARFEAGQFDSILKQVDILSGSENTLPDWFYRPVWRRRQGARIDKAAIRHRRTLVFADGSDLGEGLCETLRARTLIFGGLVSGPEWDAVEPLVSGFAPFPAACIRVDPGSSFCRVSDTHYRICPSEPSDYCKLLEAVTVEGGTVEQIVHLWTYASCVGAPTSLEALEAAQERGTYSLLGLFQAVAAVLGPEAPVRVLVVSSHAQATRPEDILACERTTLLGLVKAVSQEMPSITCTHLDLPMDQAAPGVMSDWASEVGVETVIAELARTNDREVAYRDGQRLVVRLEHADLVHTPRQEAPFKHGGLYLLTGGLGGIGTEVARHLLSQYNARLLVIGRAPLSERIDAYESLQSLGGEIRYRSLDVCDLDGLRRAVLDAETAWECVLSGVLHLAGVYQSKSVVQETRESLATAMRAKVAGSWAVGKLMKEHPEALLVGFSSAICFFDFAMVGAYSAGNRYLESLCHVLRHQAGIRSFCVGWSYWDEVGMNRSLPGQRPIRATDRGFQTMSSEQGVHSLVAGLFAGEPHVLVGLDASNLYIRRHCELPGAELEVRRLCAYFTTPVETGTPTALKEPAVWDRFGTASVCSLVRVEEMPRTASGELDRVHLAVRDRCNGTERPERVAPRTSTQKWLVDVWRDLLGRDTIGIHDSFFDIGGHSLIAARLFDRITRHLGKNLSPAALFQAPTIEALAAILEENDWNTGYKCLVPLRTNGIRPPFFWIHHVAGDILYTQNLLRHIPEEFPMYGLQSVGLDGIDEPLTQIESMADLYIREMRSVQPNGPYYFGGYSLGCIIALEMALKLLSQGQEVGLLVMLDHVGDMVSPHYPMRSWMFERKINPWVLYAEHHYTCLRKGARQHLRKQFQAVWRAACWRARRLVGMRPSQPANARALVWRSNIAAVSAYKLRNYPGRITYFHAAERHPDNYRGTDTRLAWSDYADGGLEVHLIPGHHNNITSEPNAKVLADKLTKCLKRAHADAEGLRKS